jgi:hypothetical protein
MWGLDNTTPFAAERTWVRDHRGAEIWIVAVKASFIIGPDGSHGLDPEQAEISRAPKFAGEPATSSLLRESDLIHTKHGTDVLVEGHAYSPPGMLKPIVDAGLKLASIDKTIRAIGDRTIERGALGMGIRLSDPQPFARMPIAYERSFGGTDQKSQDNKEHGWEPRNPVGVGFAMNKEHIIGTPAPNIEEPKTPYSDWRRGEPAGFGPIARHWSPRVKLAGTYDEAWEKKRRPLLPSDFDERFYQCAPADQQVDGFLKGGERVELHNLTPEGLLSFELPRITLGMTTWFYDATEVTHRAALHTVTLQPDKRKFQMVWHSQLPCHSKVNKLRVTEVVVKQRLGSADDYA